MSQTGKGNTLAAFAKMLAAHISEVIAVGLMAPSERELSRQVTEGERDTKKEKQSHHQRIILDGCSAFFIFQTFAYIRTVLAPCPQ